MNLYLSLNLFSLLSKLLKLTQTLKHLSKSKTAGLTSEHLVQCVAQIKDLGLRLTEAETIQTANLLPSSDVELYLIIEDCSDRVTPEQQEKLFEIINNTIALTTAGASAK